LDYKEGTPAQRLLKKGIEKASLQKGLDIPCAFLTSCSSFIFGGGVPEV
jgi:hypothetical protein